MIYPLAQNLAPLSVARRLRRYAREVFADAPVAFWPLNDVGLIARDASGNGVDATYLPNNGVIWTNGNQQIAGAIANDANKCAEFTGAGYVGITDRPSLRLANAFTVEAWVYPTSFADFRTILWKGGNLDRNYDFDIAQTTGNPRIYVTKAGAFFGVDLAPAVPLNAWTYLAATYDGATLRLFVNAAERGSVAVAAPIDAPLKMAAIGRAGELNSSFFLGRIDEVAIYNYALSAARILAHYNAGIGA
jgi:Concanavalin A-like lectin/glucanases superfamily